MTPGDLVTSDIENFWRAFDLAESSDKKHHPEIYREVYFDQGSIGLQDFITLRIESAESLVETVEKHGRYYRSVRPITNRLGDITKTVGEKCLKFTRYYPKAILPNVYFVIGKLSSAGTPSDNGILIGTEMFGRSAETNIDELSAWHRQAISNLQGIPGVVVHELIHIQQRYPNDPRTVLGQAILEGSASFLTGLIFSDETNNLRSDSSHEEELLWNEFSAEMHEYDHSNWFGASSMKDNRPPDLGYSIGAKICESYCSNAPDLKQAIDDILNIQNFEDFLRDSGYPKKFHR